MNVSLLIKALALALGAAATLVALISGLVWFVWSAPAWAVVGVFTVIAALGITPAIYSGLQAASRHR